jgi:short-subunit dehydrogenase
MKIAILGATSRIAQDLILSFSKNKEYNFSLFSRNIKLLKEWASSANLNGEYQVQAYSVDLRLLISIVATVFSSTGF